MNIEDMRRAREESANVAYMTFNKHIREGKLGLFCFFEGKDSPYYISRIRMFYNTNYYPIICSGKSKVLKVNELIQCHREYDDFKTAFFIDKDFDPPVMNPKIYETPCYAIENFYTNPTVFAEILKSEFGFTEVDDDFKKCVQLYTQLQKEFHEAVTLFNAWYACLIHIRNTSNLLTGVSLGDAPIPKEFVTIALTGVSNNYDMNALRAKYPESLHIDNQIVINKIIEFSTQEKGKLFRGKFEIDFMLRVLTALIEDSKTTKLYISKLIKYNITNTQAISQFSQYAETPACLIRYLQKVTL
jgi:Protein of unknown function (DUF4435)